ncbi:MAG: M48 family metalloprotease [Fimbriimonadaceae bacterium]|nr:M48 family metalloprotease [Chitinophagales bacterium]
MKKNRLLISTCITITFITIFNLSCSNGGGINIFSIEDDKALGEQLDAEILADPTMYPILSESTYDDAYDLMNDIRDRILASGKITYADEFVWKLRIIHDDEILNAFCTPGGYIYVYTGLIKYLENEAQLAGVLGHEMAHADLRHVTDQLTEQYGISLLVSIVLGENSSVLTDIAIGLAGLAFSRGDESQADEYSVIYLCPTEYYAAGAAGFFEKIEAEGGTNIPEFLSTHPNPENRIEDIYATYDELMCGEGELFESRYDDLIDALP